jgi:hypothetical protein
MCLFLNCEMFARSGAELVVSADLVGSRNTAAARMLLALGASRDEYRVGSVPIRGLA